MGTKELTRAVGRPLLPTELVVPLDGSALSVDALPVAAAIADALGATVSVVDCLPPYLDAGPEVVWMDERVEAAGVVVVDEEVHLATDIVGDLLATLEARPGSTLCAASHGRTGITEVMLGSITRGLLLRAPVPLVIVGPNAKIPDRFDTVQVCYDGSAEGEATLDVAARWAQALGATPWVTHVVETTDPGENRGDFAIDALVVNAASRLRELGLAPGWDVLPGRHPAEALTSWARAHESDLIVMRTHRRGLLERALGTVTARLLHLAPCPVVVLGPEVTG